VEEAQRNGKDRGLPGADRGSPFEAERPADFGENGDREDDPRHGMILSSLRARKEQRSRKPERGCAHRHKRMSWARALDQLVRGGKRLMHLQERAPFGEGFYPPSQPATSTATLFAARVSASPTGFASTLPPIGSRTSKRRWVTVLPPAATSIA